MWILINGGVWCQSKKFDSIFYNKNLEYNEWNYVYFCCVCCSLQYKTTIHVCYIITVNLSQNVLNFITFFILLFHRVMRNIGFKVSEIKKNIVVFFGIIKRKSFSLTRFCWYHISNWLGLCMREYIW